MHQYRLEGFRNVRLSDYESHPYNEGSLLLALDGLNGAGFGIGGTFGGRAELSDSFDMIAEVTASYAGKGGVFANVSAGVLYNIMNAKMRLGVGAKAGYYVYSKNLGNARILEGTRPPVILSEGTIRNGSPISYTASGISIAPIVDFSMRVSRNVAVGVQAGYQFCIPIKSALMAKTDGGKSISIDPKTHASAYYDPEAEGLVRMEFNPKAEVNGFIGTVYCTYVF